MSRELRWTEHAVNQLGALAEYISLASPVYADQLVERVVVRLHQAQEFPESGRRVPEAPNVDLRELIEPPYRIVYRATHRTTSRTRSSASLGTRTAVSSPAR